MTKQVRDWQGDMEMCEQSKANGFSDGLSFLTILPEIGIYWLQQYAVWKVKAHEAESREKKLREALETAIKEKAVWGDAGNALDVVVRYLGDTLASLYPEEGTPQIKPLNNEDMQASQAFINRAMRED